MTSSSRARRFVALRAGVASRGARRAAHRARARAGSALGLGCGLVVLCGLLACQDDDREDAFAAVAPSLEMTLREALPPAAAEAIRGLPGIAFRDRNFFPRVLAREDAMIFDWTWRDDRLKDRERGTQTVFAIRFEGAALPPFVLAELGALSEAEARAAGGRVPFASPPHWIDRFVLASRARAPLRELFPGDVRSTFALPADARIEGNGEWAVVYRPGRLANPGTFEGELRDARSLLVHWARP